MDYPQLVEHDASRAAHPNRSHWTSSASVFSLLLRWGTTPPSNLSLVGDRWSLMVSVLDHRRGVLARHRSLLLGVEPTPLRLGRLAEILGVRDAHALLEARARPSTSCEAG